MFGFFLCTYVNTPYLNKTHGFGGGKVLLENLVIKLL